MGSGGGWGVGGGWGLGECFESADGLDHGADGVVADLPGVGEVAVEDVAAAAESFVPLAVGVHGDEVVEDVVVDVGEGVPVFVIAEEGDGVEHGDEDFGVLPELFFGELGGVVHGDVGVDAAEFGVDAEGDAMVADVAEDVGVGLAGEV